MRISVTGHNFVEPLSFEGTAEECVSILRDWGGVIEDVDKLQPGETAEIPEKDTGWTLLVEIGE